MNGGSGSVGGHFHLLEVRHENIGLPDLSTDIRRYQLCSKASSPAKSRSKCWIISSRTRRCLFNLARETRHFRHLAELQRVLCGDERDAHLILSDATNSPR